MAEYWLKHFDSYLYLLQVFADYQITNISMGSNLVRIFLKFIGIHFLVIIQKIVKLQSNIVPDLVQVYKSWWVPTLK